MLQSAVPSLFSWTTDKHTRPSPTKRRYSETVSDQTLTDFCGEKDILKPPSGDHDYCLAQEKAEEVHSQLVAAKREIERLQKELERATSLSRFGLLRYSYNEEMINFYIGFPSWNLLECLFLWSSLVPTKLKHGHKNSGIELNKTKTSQLQ